MGGYIAYLLFDTLRSEKSISAQVAFFFAVGWPKFLMCAGAAGVLIFFLIWNWHGNVNRMLLLKLLDAQISKDDRPN
jgi:hypothetical protein